ncbi:MAG: cation:proton antiporter [Microgenomates group bacterium]
MNNVFIQLGVVLSLCSALGFIVYKLKLPLVVAYLLTGVILSFLSLFDITHSLILNILPDIGIAFVLFLIGMELDLREVKSLGIPIITSAVGQVIVSTFVGFFIANQLGFGTTESIYLGLGLAFSSTVVVIKMLLEKRDLGSLYGKLSIGILLVEDIMAIVVLMIASVGSSSFHIGFQQNLPLVTLLVKTAGLFLLTFVLSKYVLERVFDAVAKSTELLFFTAITWCFVFTSLAVISGFSIVIGAFLAGVALATSPYHLQIQGKIKPLRDFFLTLFFVYLGTQVRISDLTSAWPAIVVFTAFAIVLKPLIYSLILSFFGFRKHTLFQTSINLSQVSEFSLIVLLVGVQFGLASPLALSVMAAVAVLSIIFSSILISSSRKIYRLASPLLSIFERKAGIHLLESKNESDFNDHVIIIGAHRIGGPVVKYLKKAKIPFLVMDFNPTIVKKLRDDGVNVVYGDIGDPEVLDNLQIEKAKLIISTANDMQDNELLLEECIRRKTKATIVVRVEEINHGKRLKEMGAHYVILPEKVSGVYLVNQLKTHWPRAHFSGLGR